MKSEQTILHLVTDLRLGGTQRILLDRVRGLPQFRHALLVFARRTGPAVTGPTPDLARDFEEAGAQVHALGWPTRTLVARAWLSSLLARRCRQIVSEVRPALLHSTLFHSHLLGDLIARGHPVPHLASKEGTDDWMNGLERAWEGRILARCPRVVAVSQAVREVLLRLRVAPERIVVIPNGVDPARPGNWKLPPARPRLLGVGRMERVKGWEDLLEALALLRRDHPEISLDLLGEGSREPHLRHQARRLGVAASVRFHSPGSEETAINATGTGEEESPLLLVVPSREEGFGLVLLEGMARGCAVVASAVGGIPELARHQVEALLVEPRRPAALAAAIARLLEDPALARRLARAAVLRAGEFSRERMVQAYGAQYQALLDSRA